MMKRTNFGVLAFASAPVLAFAEPTGTWIGCSWEGTPAVINEIVVWDPDGLGPLAAAPFLATDGGVFFKDTDGTIRNFEGFDARVNAITVWDPDGSGPAPASLILAIQSLLFGPTNVWAMVPQPGGGTAGQFLGNFDNDVRSLTTYDTDGDGFDELVAAGAFENLLDGDPPTPMNKTAVLDGNTWSQLGTAPNATCQVVVSVPCHAGNSAIACDGDSTLVVGGFFTQAGGLDADALACWDMQSSDWRPCELSSGLAGTTVIRAVAGWDFGGSTTELLVVGFGIRVDGVNTGNIAHLEASGWSPLADGFFGNLEAVTTFDVDGDGEPEPIAATVVSEGGQFPFQIRFWDGGAWRLLDGGEIVAGGFTQVKDYLSFDADGPGGAGPELIVVGSFSSATIAGVSGIDHLAVWVPDLAGGPCNDADLVEPFGVLDFFDLQAYLNLYSTGDPDADLNGDGLIDFFDVQAYLNAFAGGCP
jgi:hypothetical protein